MGMTYREIEVDAKEATDVALSEAREVILKRDFDDYAVKKQLLQNAVGDWNVARNHVKYEEWLATPNPVMSAIRDFYVTVNRVKEEHDEDSGKVIGVKLVENTKYRVDIEDFVEFANENPETELDKRWLRDCAELLGLLQLRKTDIYRMTPAELVKSSDLFIKAFNKKKNGETPDSNTKIVALLQKIVDATIFEDNGKGLNKHKCTVKDIIYIEDCAHQFDPKAKSGIRSLKPRAFQTVMVSVLYSMLTGEGYTVKNAKIKRD